MSTSATSAATGTTTFAVIGDYGTNDKNERAVAGLVASWSPAFVIAVGDNYVSRTGTGPSKYDETVGAYYGNWLKDVAPTKQGATVGRAPINAFFPALGNHDYLGTPPSPAAYLTYFNLPGMGFNNSSGNERYYDFVEGPVHFFVLDSNPEGFDGMGSGSPQGQWLRRQLAASTSPWNVVYDHHPPYSSESLHGSTEYMQWPFAAWGADVVISGHSHVYERIMRDGIVYFVNGLGGQGRYDFAAPVAGSAIRYNADFGAQKVTASETALDFNFYNVRGQLIDGFQLTATPPAAK